MTREIARDGVECAWAGGSTGSPGAAEAGCSCWTIGEEVQADVVVATTGERPDTDWLRGLPGVDVSDGILCDEALRVVGLPGVVAAGTTARWPNLRYDATPRRVGQWITALEQGRGRARADDGRVRAGLHARAALLVRPVRVAHPGVRRPAGRGRGDTDRAAPRGRRPARDGIAVGYRVDGELVGLVAVNAPQAFTAITRTMLATASSRVLATVAGPPATPARPALTAVPSAAPERLALPGPAGPPPISGPLPVGPRLFAVR